MWRVLAGFVAAMAIVMAAITLALEALDGGPRQAFPIDANPGAWPHDAAADLCLPPVRPDPRPHGLMDPVDRWETDHRTIA